MSGNGPLPGETVLCGRCAMVCDPEDNFCRQCGLPLHDQSRLPSLREDGDLPVVWQPSLPAAVVRGAAVVAVGTLAEMLVRRLVRSALRRKPRAAQVPARLEPIQVAERGESLPPDTQMVSETFLLRRVRFRR